MQTQCSRHGCSGSTTSVRSTHALTQPAPQRRRPSAFSTHRQQSPARRQPAAGQRTAVPRAGAAETHLAPEQVAVVAVEVEQGPSNSRRLYAGIDIAAPWDDVWSALTDYDGLADFIPGLAKNECLSRHPAGARLLQIGEQSLAMGLKFRARVVLDIEEHPSGLAHHLIDDMAVDEGRFPGPRSPPSEGDAHDISFALQEGDFQAFRGVWRMQQQDPDSSADRKSVV